MAKKIVREIVIDAQTKEAIKNMDKLGKTFEDVFETSNKGLKPLTTQIGELEDAMYALAAAGESNSQEFKDLQQRVGNYKKVIIETDLQIDAMAETTSQNLGGAIEGVSGAFAIGTGAMGAFGVESEAVDEALLRVQSAMAITQGINSVRNGIKAFKGLKAAIMASTVVQKVLNFVMSLNPIGLIIIGVTALIALVAALFKPVQDLMNAWFGVAEATESAEEMNERLNESYEKTIKLLDRIIKNAVDNQKRKLELMKLEGKSEKDIHKERLRLIRIERQGAKEKLKLEKAFITDKKVAYKKALAEENFELAKSIREEIESSRDKYKDLVAQDKDFRHQLKIERLQFQKDEDARNDAAQSERRAKWKAYQDRLKQDAADRLAAERAIEDAEQELKEQNRETDIENARIANRRKLEDLKLDKSLEKSERLALEKLALEELGQQELEINAKYDAIKDEKEAARNQKRIEKEDAQHQLEVQLIKDNQERELQLLIESYDKKFEIANGNAELEKQLTESLNTEIAAINKKYNDEEIAENKKKEDKKKADREAALAGVGNALSALSGLSAAITDAELAKAGDDEAKKERIRKKAFERDKKLQLASAIITGIQSVMSAYQSGSAIPVIGIVMGPLMAAIAAATAAMNISKIKNSKYESTATPSASVPSAASTVSAPQFNIAGNSPENQLAQTLGQEQQPVKAFVVAGDVTTAQSLERDKVELTGL
jgi:hypothetical protein